MFLLIRGKGMTQGERVKDLHSTMFLLIQDIFNIFCCYTHIYIPQCFY